MMSFAWLRRYLADRDPRVALANFVALLIVLNQPFYPLYVYAAVGEGAWVTLVSFLSTALFAAVPAAGRYSAMAGRILLCAAGTGNTAMCMWALGEASGVALFLLPCLMLGVLLFLPRERAGMAVGAGLPVLAFLALHDRLPAPWHDFSAAQNQALITLHAVSVGCLVLVIAYAFVTRVAAPRSGAAE